MLIVKQYNNAGYSARMHFLQMECLKVRWQAEMPVDKVSECKKPVDKVSVNKMSVRQMPIEDASVEKVSKKEISVD